MAIEVIFHPLAENDLNNLYDYIAEESPERAIRLIRRIRARALSLMTMPQKGRARNDLGLGVRKIAFERRAVIAYRIDNDAVLILRIFYAGQNLQMDPQ